MKIIYGAAWAVIIGFLAWSGNLLIDIQSLGKGMSALHHLTANLEELADAWQDINRPGNDVLDNYDVAAQRNALQTYLAKYLADFERVRTRVDGDPGLAPLLDDLDQRRLMVIGLAENVLTLAAERERLRLAGADPSAISGRATEAASTMAKMDQEFQAGLDMILHAGLIIVSRERIIEDQQAANFRRLYVMLLATLLASALSIELIRHTMRQREALRESSARISTIVNNVVDGIIAVDDRGDIESVNEPAERMFGYAPGGLVGRSFVLLLEEHCRKHYLAKWRASVESGAASLASDECEESAARSDGTTFPIELAIRQVALEGKRLSIHIVRDVTFRRQADQKLRLAANVFENISEGIVVTDPDGNIQSVNPAYTAITQYSAAELIGANPKLVKSGRQPPEFYRGMWSAISTAGQWKGEIWNRRKNGEIFPQWLTISAIKDARGRITNYVGVAWDITELKASEQKKEEFITTVSHELRTPLTSVLGSLGMLMRDMTGQLPEPARRLVAIAHSNSRRLVRLISDILDIEKIEAGRMTFEFEPLELTETVARVISDSRALAEESGVIIRVNEQAAARWVSGDADRLMQVLTNLIANAIKFSPSGGEVEVDTGEHEDMYRVSITDHGPGIPEEFRSEVFKKFAQVNDPHTRSKGGTGLGLSIAKLIVLQHGGTIDFESTPGVSTTFYVDLPRMRFEVSDSALRLDNDSAAGGPQSGNG